MRPCLSVHRKRKKAQALAPGLGGRDYGWLTILATLYWLLDKLHSFINNWGWYIVALVLLHNSVLLAQCQAYASMAKMKAINPKITEMRERLKDKPQEMQQAMMKIWDERSTMGGCFPI
jgi:YidC/Oxa1 family membrane protein insertase